MVLHYALNILSTYIPKTKTIQPNYPPLILKRKRKKKKKKKTVGVRITTSIFISLKGYVVFLFLFFFEIKGYVVKYNFPCNCLLTMLCKSVVGSILYINRWIFKDDHIWRHHIINNISQGSIQICLCIIHVFNNYLPMVRLKLKLIYNVALKLCHSACDVLISLPNEMTTFKGAGQMGKD